MNTDADGYGNACDCDFDQNGTCNIADFSVLRVDYSNLWDSGVGTDMDGNGWVGIDDFSLFRDGYVAGAPGPSGLVSPGGSAAMAEMGCGLGVELALLLAPLMWLWRRRRRRV